MKKSLKANWIDMTKFLREIEKRGLFIRSQKKGEKRSRFSEFRGAVISKIQGAAKNLIKAEESFFVILWKNKEGFDDYLRGILDKKTGDYS